MRAVPYLARAFLLHLQVTAFLPLSSISKLQPREQSLTVSQLPLPRENTPSQTHTNFRHYQSSGHTFMIPNTPSKAQATTLKTSIWPLTQPLRSNSSKTSAARTFLLLSLSYLVSGLAHLQVHFSGPCSSTRFVRLWI